VSHEAISAEYTANHLETVGVECIAVRINKMSCYELNVSGDAGAQQAYLTAEVRSIAEEGPSD